MYVIDKCKNFVCGGYSLCVSMWLQVCACVCIYRCVGEGIVYV